MDGRIYASEDEGTERWGLGVDKFDRQGCRISRRVMGLIANSSEHTERGSSTTSSLVAQGRRGPPNTRTLLSARSGQCIQIGSSWTNLVCEWKWEPVCDAPDRCVRGRSFWNKKSSRVMVLIRGRNASNDRGVWRPSALSRCHGTEALPSGSPEGGSWPVGVGS